MSTITDILIGLLSGMLSSWLVSECLKKKWDKEQQIKDFENDKQNYERYLGRLRYELFLGNKMKDYSFFLRAFEEEPIRNTFQMNVLKYQMKKHR